MEPIVGDLFDMSSSRTNFCREMEAGLDHEGQV